MDLMRLENGHLGNDQSKIFLQKNGINLENESCKKRFSFNGIFFQYGKTLYK